METANFCKSDLTQITNDKAQISNQFFTLKNKKAVNDRKVNISAYIYILLSVTKALIQQGKNS